MRKDILALGMFAMLLGLVFLSASRTAIEPGLKWDVVVNTRANVSTEKLSLEGNLTEGDRFQVNFALDQSSAQPFLMEPEVQVNVTDPNGDSKLYSIRLTSVDSTFARLDPFPEDVANYTGTYNVTAEAFEILLKNLILTKLGFVKTDPDYPYSFLFPVGIAILLGGSGISLLAVKISKRKKVRYKLRFEQHTGRFVDLVCRYPS
jgi:hypothetical protein